ncbi:hypothetical protein RFI_06358 [Reticulomyxa filosa]|uniref:Uncharacterized protein n=1 Tax=Reticulomyxa filosa TaxID=46433 RepID=X6NXP5_RETFI|nr:hypothetical protein RFI_06358 [Reticulomyxa filosa]|eukprot:ETO30761.1 hypothetical protein RFI_06358 [Reticulomyxa filosa]
MLGNYQYCFEIRKSLIFSILYEQAGFLVRNDQNVDTIHFYCVSSLSGYRSLSFFRVAGTTAWLPPPSQQGENIEILSPAKEIEMITLYPLSYTADPSFAIQEFNNNQMRKFTICRTITMDEMDEKKSSDGMASIVEVQSYYIDISFFGSSGNSLPKGYLIRKPSYDFDIYYANFNQLFVIALQGVNCEVLYFQKKKQVHTYRIETPTDTVVRFVSFFQTDITKTKIALLLEHRMSQDDSGMLQDNSGIVNTVQLQVHHASKTIASFELDNAFIANAMEINVHGSYAAIICERCNLFLVNLHNLAYNRCEAILTLRLDNSPKHNDLGSYQIVKWVTESILAVSTSGRLQFFVDTLCLPSVRQLLMSCCQGVAVVADLIAMICGPILHDTKYRLLAHDAEDTIRDVTCIDSFYHANKKKGLLLLGIKHKILCLSYTVE